MSPVIKDPVPEDDFRGDGTSDILWRNQSTSALTLWEVSPTGVVTANGVIFEGSPVAPSSAWSIDAISDFDGNRTADVVWRNAISGELDLWSMNGSSITTSSQITDIARDPVRPDASWRIIGDGDFNNDGLNDLLWRNTRGTVDLWTMKGSTIADSEHVTFHGMAVNVDKNWSVAGIGDTNGDGNADVIWRNSATNDLEDWMMSGSTITSSSHFTFNGAAVNPDQSWSVAGVGDFNDDGNADLLWRNNHGTLNEWQLNGSTIMSSSQLTFNGSAVSPDASWKLIEVGDFNGDGKSDLVWRNQNTDAMAIWLMNGSTITASVTPTQNALPATLDNTWQPQANPTNLA